MKKYLLIFSLLACQNTLPEIPKQQLPNNSLSLKVHVLVPQSKMNGVLDGINAWAKTGLPISTTSDLGSANFIIYEVGLTEDNSNKLSCPFADSVACSNPDTGEIKLISGEYEHNTNYVVMHELGHLLAGREHIPGTIMQSQPSPEMWNAHWVCPDAITVARVEKNLGVHGLKGCPFPKM